jgi:2-(1,2-epoxy-1,2-dihydrophenyl)acetyl-CoA isomerase
MELVLSEIKNQVAFITLNRPDKFNSFTNEMAKSFQEKLKAAAQNEEVRAVLLTATGKAFCAGQDLGEATSDAFPGFEAVVSEHYNPIIELIRTMPKPVIVAVNGVAAGAGANIALAGDIVVAHEQASFIQAFSKIGLVPDSGGSYFLPRLIGMQRATALLMLGDKINAAEALQMGMVYKVFSASEFETEAQKLALAVAQMPTKALAMTKEMLNQTFQNSLSEQLALECKLQVAAGAGADYAEGVAAFLEKRAPYFKGV